MCKSPEFDHPFTWLLMQCFICEKQKLLKHNIQRMKSLIKIEKNDNEIGKNLPNSQRRIFFFLLVSFIVSVCCYVSYTQFTIRTTSLSMFKISTAVEPSVQLNGSTPVCLYGDMCDIRRLVNFSMVN